MSYGPEPPIYERINAAGNLSLKDVGEMIAGVREIIDTYLD